MNGESEDSRVTLKAYLEEVIRLRHKAIDSEFRRVWDRFDSIGAAVVEAAKSKQELIADERIHHERQNRSVALIVSIGFLALSILGLLITALGFLFRVWMVAK